ncbi:type II toxin-antitoxin system ParD family antitoxin [bacterium]|nr:type II toxin-antitoxin system ParD family antitoxin [bacterium]
MNQSCSSGKEDNDINHGEHTHKMSINEIRSALVEGEQSGISKRTPEEIKKFVDERLRINRCLENRKD